MEATPEHLDFRLRLYQYAVDLVGIFFPLVAGVFMYLYPQYFPWIIHPSVNIISFVVLVLFQCIDFLLFHTLHKKIFFDLSRYIYIAFFTVFLYSTGGTQSSFLFIMMFPIMVSAVDLDPETTRRIGIAVCIALTALIFTEPTHLTDPVFIINHFLHVLLFAFLAYFMYKLVRETLAQKYAKEETNRKFTQLIQVDELKKDFLAVAQHQLRTPLSGIKWALETLSSDPDISKDNKELVDSGIARAKDAIGIINEMLRTAEDGTGSLTLSTGPVNIAAMIRDILKDLNYVALKRQVTVRFDGPESLIADADEKKLKPSLMNVIDNAFKYSPHGHVTVTLADTDTACIFTVQDDGIGISEEDMSLIFSRLYRGKNAIAIEPDESGVGLYTAKKMIELHRGTIKLDSKLGKGTTVTVTLPK